MGWSPHEKYPFMITQRFITITALWFGFLGALVLAAATPGTAQVLITIATTNEDNVVVSWPDCGVLQTTTDLTQPWTSLPAATSPYEVSITGTSQFFRLAPLMTTVTSYMGTNAADTNAACVLELDPANLTFQFFATNGIFGETDFGLLDDETVDYVAGTNGASGQYLLSGTFGDLTFVGLVDLCPDYTGYIEIIQGGVIKIIYQLGLAQVYIDGDGNHDGMTTDSAADRAGKDINPGCITLNNLDSHGATDPVTGDLISDNQTEEIQGAAHQAELASVIVRRIPIIPAGWTVTLTLHDVANGEGAYGADPAVGDAGVVQMLSPSPAAAAGAYGTAILGGAGGATSWDFPANDPSLVDLTTVKAKDITLYAEGLQRAFAASIKMSLELRDAANNLVSSDELQLKVAPLIFLPNTIDAEEAYVSEVGFPARNNAIFCNTFIGDLPAGVTGNTIPGVRPAPPLPPPPPPALLNGGRDQWARDEFKFGYQQAPFKTDGMIVVLHSKRGGELQAFPPTLLAQGIGYMPPISTPGLAPASKDSFGNLEVSPPCTDAKGKNYPLGRIYYGGGGGPGADAMDPRLVDFLTRQGVQSPVQLYSDWLTVGHVDEFMSIVPDGAASQGWRVLLADTTIPMNIFKGRVAGLAKVNQATFNVNPKYAALVPPINVLANLWTHRLKAQTRILKTVQQWNFNGFVNTPPDILARIKVKLQAEFGLAAGDFTSVPVLFDRVGPNGECDALTPDLVNGAVYQGTFIAPDDFLYVAPAVSPFQNYFDAVTAGIVPVTYIDDWDFYHLRLGEVHCGSNEQRELPPPAQWPEWWNN